MSQKRIQSPTRLMLEEEVQQLLQIAMSQALSEAEKKINQTPMQLTPEHISVTLRTMMRGGNDSEINKHLKQTAKQIVTLCRQGQISGHPLIRMASEKLQALSVGSDEIATPGKNLYPAIVPGVCAALETMVGDDMLKKWRRQYRDHQNKARANAGQKAFDEFAQVKNYLFEELLLEIMEFLFKGVDRYDWFYVHVEKNIAPIKDGGESHIPIWEFKLIDYKFTMVILYRSLFQQLRDPRQSEILLKRIGYEKLETLKNLLSMIGSL